MEALTRFAVRASSCLSIRLLKFKCLLDNTVFTVAGRHYELMAEPQPWVEALFFASKAHCFGMPGHLATLETEAEWQVRGVER